MLMLIKPINRMHGQLSALCLAGGMFSVARRAEADLPSLLVSLVPPASVQRERELEFYTGSLS
ncbi:MAG TPA: hypothetical protein VKY92_20685 [Verrucomicrobiae bacterium]|nr:hypothetical protein [Verrucomicrobiae bacterium]